MYGLGPTIADMTQKSILSIRNSKTSGITPGADYSAYPKAFSWTAGVNITF